MWTSLHKHLSFISHLWSWAILFRCFSHTLFVCGMWSDESKPHKYQNIVLLFHHHRAWKYFLYSPFNLYMFLKKHFHGSFRQYDGFLFHYDDLWCCWYMLIITHSYRSLIIRPWNVAVYVYIFLCISSFFFFCMVIVESSLCIKLTANPNNLLNICMNKILLAWQSCNSTTQQRLLCTNTSGWSCIRWWAQQHSGMTSVSLAGYADVSVLWLLL